MKIDINLIGSAPAVPDYEMLRAALLAAQSSTPTARAAREMRDQLPARDALEQMFTGEAPADAVAPALDHRFAPDPKTAGDAA